MTRPTYLFDASSIVRALREVKLVPLGGQAIQWLTVYEVLNAFWKEANLLHRLDPEEAGSLVSDFTEVIREMVVLEPRGLEQSIFRIAVSKGATIYDASYIALAAKYNLVLVTEDQKLSRIASDTVNVVSLNDLA
ncbi:type II toxin-antitoxin system VapC family toxin [Aeropyrum camini]|uniref:Predicted nucleic acid-binding protein n=1 Tax=Aeropyrum camini SY1 = JCM 12091 TaxID=1198449 RepID=U3TGJ3_9CREN|nr:type II toxin-antitoxin system VapC family toxin [Aeropyrum camini]BAN91113.1 predicted nucleic acid-binding protein [Aeropyrum camini SY1 = JCM 12091]